MRVAAGAGTYLSRMRGYLREMFPLLIDLAFALLAGAGIAGFLRTVHGGDVSFAAAAVASPAWNIFATLLILRLMDGLKDRDIDRRLFPDRPLPSGRVLESDIRRTLAATIVLYLAANAYAAPVFLAAALVLGYAGLMYWRFFAPARLERSLPLTLATHTPVVPLLLLQAHVAAADRLGIPPGELRWADILPAVAMVWCSILGWELARKIRAPAEETAYVTYSRILGPAGAVAAAAAAQGLAVALGVHLAVRFRLPPWHPATLGAAWVLCAAAYARFLLPAGPAHLEAEAVRRRVRARGAAGAPRRVRPRTLTPWGSRRTPSTLRPRAAISSCAATSTAGIATGSRPSSGACWRSSPHRSPSIASPATRTATSSRPPAGSRWGT